MFGATTEGTTVPYTIASTSRPSRLARCTSSATQSFPSSIALRLFRLVPARANGVRTPATMATRRPGVPSDVMGGNWLSFDPMQARPTRDEQLATLDARIFDLLVVGGGITGCGIAREAALRGLS